MCLKTSFIPTSCIQTSCIQTSCIQTSCTQTSCIQTSCIQTSCIQTLYSDLSHSFKLIVFYFLEQDSFRFLRIQFAGNTNQTIGWMSCKIAQIIFSWNNVDETILLFLLSKLQTDFFHRNCSKFQCLEFAAGVKHNQFYGKELLASYTGTS